jgi:hypothetical protein
MEYKEKQESGMMDSLLFQAQEHARTEELIERAIKALRVELEAMHEAAKRIEELVARLRMKRAGK